MLGKALIVVALFLSLALGYALLRWDIVRTIDDRMAIAGGRAPAKSRPHAGAETFPDANSSGVLVTVDDFETPALYSSNARVWGSAEEVNLDFGESIRPTGPNTALLKINQRVILNPIAAKRLVVLLGEYLQQYEATYGTIELDEKKRRVNPPTLVH